MIGAAREVYVASVPIDLRLSFDRLAAIVREQLGDEPRGDALFIFHNRQRTHVRCASGSTHSLAGLAALVGPGPGPGTA